LAGSERADGGVAVVAVRDRLENNLERPINV